MALLQINCSLMCVTVCFWGNIAHLCSSPAPSNTHLLHILNTGWTDDSLVLVCSCYLLRLVSRSHILFLVLVSILLKFDIPEMNKFLPKVSENEYVLANSFTRFEWFEKYPFCDFDSYFVIRNI